MSIVSESRPEPVVEAKEHDGRSVAEFHEYLHAKLLGALQLLREDIDPDSADYLAYPLWKEFNIGASVGHIHIDEGAVVIVTNRLGAYDIFGDGLVDSYDEQTGFRSHAFIFGLHEEGVKMHGVRNIKTKGIRQTGRMLDVDDSARLRRIFEQAVDCCDQDTDEKIRRRMYRTLGRVASL